MALAWYPSEQWLPSPRLVADRDSPSPPPVGLSRFVFRETFGVVLFTRRLIVSLKFRFVLALILANPRRTSSGKPAPTLGTRFWRRGSAIAP